MGNPLEFAYVVQGTDVVISHHGKTATVLRGDKARRFLNDIEAGEADDAQHLMARVTGNYRRGNERAGKRSPRYGR